MADASPLRRAHALSAQASLLLRPANARSQTLHEALDAYRQAADLFEQSASTDEGATRTLELLTVQHRKLARDLERRIGAGHAPPEAVAKPLDAVAGGAKPVQDTASTGGRTEKISGPGLSPPLGMPPFALRPPIPHQTHSQPPPRPPDPTHTLSPLHSSSSSSSAPEDSFLHLDTLDPFSRFWGALETMLDDISNPVAFASAPLALPPAPLDDSPHKVRRALRGRRKDTSKEKEKGKGKAKAKDEPASPSESFFLVSNTRSSEAEGEGEGGGDEPSNPSPSSKTPEELALENDSLRTSLDALALRAHALEHANLALTRAGEERDRMMRSVVSGVRREAQKAKAGQEVMRSQLLASGSAPRSAGRLDDTSSSAGLRKKACELEEEVKSLKEENAKQRGQIDKYKDRFDKLKVNARAKREAKLEEEGGKRERG